MPSPPSIFQPFARGAFAGLRLVGLVGGNAARATRLIRQRFVSLVPLLALASLVSLASCARDPSLQLIQVLEVAPREAEVGERLAIMGAGFPQGKTAHLAFRGTLHRPGERPIDGVEISAQGLVVTAQQIELLFNDALEESFCGVADNAVHTTFEGELDVAFAAASPGAAPIAATLYKVVLDVRPPAPKSAILRARDAEGERALSFFGITTSPVLPGAGGIAIDTVVPGSRADRSGIVAGDVLSTFDGVRVSGRADVVPHPGAQTSFVTVRRGTDPREQVREIAVDGFKGAPASELLGAAVVLASAAALILLFVAPSLGGFGWIERRMAVRLQRLFKDRRREGGRIAYAIGALLPRGLSARSALSSTGWAPRDTAPYLVFAGVSAAFAAMPFGQYVIAANLDIATIFVVAVTALAIIALLTAGGVGAHYSLFAALRAVAHALSAQIPSAIAIVCIVVVTGSVRLQDIIAAQGGLPWNWYAFQSPAMLGLFLLSLATAIGDATSEPPVFAEAEGGEAPIDRPTPASSGARGRAVLFFLAGWANVFAMCGLASAIFLGGWQLPGVATAQQQSHVALELLGSALFLIKAWTLVVAVAGLRRILPVVRAPQMTAWCWKYLVPASLVGLASSVGWVIWCPPQALRVMISGALCALTLLALAHAFQRLRYALKTTHAHAHLNPFL